MDHSRLLPRSSVGVVAGAALLVALGGTSGAVAGSLITGKQIKDGTVTSADIKNKTVTRADLAPSARTGTPGSPGKPGADGARGPQGAPGPTGPQGVPGPVTGRLPSGATLAGTWMLDEESGSPAGVRSSEMVSLGLRGPARPTTKVVIPGEAKPAECQGTVWNPTAAPGTFCVYVSFVNGYAESSVTTWGLGSPTDESQHFPTAGLAPVGGFIQALTEGAADHVMQGVWAYTAP